MLLPPTEISPALREACQLQWRPGATLHPDWWSHWGMQPLSALYSGAPHSLQRQIDTRIIGVRNLPDWRPVNLSSSQQALLRLRSAPEMLIGALGLLALGCPGYLRFRYYRRHLEAQFTARQLDQVSVLMRESGAPAEIVPAELPRACLDAGLAVLDTHQHDCPLWRCLRFTFPRSDVPSAAIHLRDEPVSMLARLERFL